MSILRLRSCSHAYRVFQTMSLVIEKILEILQAQAEATAEIFDVMTSGYGASYQKARRAIERGPRQFATRWAEAYRERQRFSSLLQYLKQQGFIEYEKKYSVWKITVEGVKKLIHLKARNRLRKTVAAYESEADDKLTIITFDIPEKEREKRIWVRAALLSMKFSMLQKSVWMGKRKVPRIFLEDLREKRMLGYIHIFEVSKKGTVREVAHEIK